MSEKGDKISTAEEKAAKIKEVEREKSTGSRKRSKC